MMGDIGCLADLEVILAGLMVVSVVQIDLAGLIKRHWNMSGLQYVLNWVVT